MDFAQAKEEIRSRIDIAEFIGGYIPLKRAGAAFKACCPFHNEKTPSFTVNPARGTYHCFGCHKHGDIFTFLMETENLTFAEALNRLAEKAGVEIDRRADPRAAMRKRLYALNGELAAFYRRCLLQMKAAERARAYLASRKLDGETAEAFGLGYAPDAPRDALFTWAKKYGYGEDELLAAGVTAVSSRTGEPYDWARGRLMFPIRDERGQVVAFSGRSLEAKPARAKYVNTRETEIFKKGKVLYALDRAKSSILRAKGREAIICEGQIDVIRCHSCGFDVAVASEGTAFTKEHAALLKKSAESVVLLFDADGAGRKAARAVGAEFFELAVPVRVATMPDGEDPDSFLRDQGADAFREILARAEPLVPFLVRTLRENEPDPNSLAACNRITAAVLEVIAPCPSAVMRARALKDAAEALQVPVAALEEELARHLAELRRREEMRARFRAGDPKPAEGKSVSAAAREPSAPADEEVSPADDEAAALEALDAAANAPAFDPPSKAERTLCELLVEFEHDEDVLALVERYLPLSIVQNRFTAGFAAAVLAERTMGDAALVSFKAGLNDEENRFWSRLFSARAKMALAREFSKQDAVQEVIRALWIAEWRRRQGALDAHDDSDAALRERVRLSCLVKKFRTRPWAELAVDCTAQGES